MPNPILETPTTDIAEILHQAKVQKRNALIIKIMMRLFMVLSIFACLAGTMILLMTSGAGLFRESPTYIVWVVLLLVYSSFLVVPFLLSMPVILPLALRNRNVDRIVVFRKFNSKPSSKALLKFIRPIISNYGHVFTLSDSRFRAKWYIKIPVLLGQTSFYHFRQRTIKDEKSKEELDRKLLQKGWLNINWLLSTSKIFSVKSTDEYWQEAARSLLKGSQLVIMDVSKLTAPLEWETELTKTNGLEESIILTASEENRAVAAEWKAKYDTIDDYDIPLYFYTQKGVLLDKKGFEQTAAGIIAKNYSHSQDRYATPALKRAFLTTGIILAVFTGILFFISPFLLPDVPGNYSPIARQVVLSYLEAHVAGEDSAHLARIKQRLQAKWPLEAASVSIHYGWHHQAAECGGVAALLSDLALPSKAADYMKLIEEGEPVMSDTAFAVVRRLHLADGRRQGLHLISMDRIDNKEKGLSLIGGERSDSLYTAQLINVLGASSYKMKPVPLQHVPADTKFINVPADSSEPRLQRYYLDLYKLLDGRLAVIDPLLLQRLNASSPDRDVRILFSLLLLRMGDGSGTGNLFDPYFITAYYKMPVKKKNTWYLFGKVPVPFKEIADSGLFKSFSVGQLPAYSVLVQNSSLSPGGDLPENFVFFLLKNYPAEDLHAFAGCLHPKELALGLYKYLRLDGLKDKTNALRIISRNKKGLEVFMRDGKMDWDDRLSAAWVLAHIGDAAVMGVASEAGKIEKKGIFWTTRPYADRAREILEEVGAGGAR